MQSLRIIIVVGARPNFIKVAPLMRELRRYPQAFQPILVHTGQHYDPRMSHAFFEGLAIAKPDIDLEIGSGSHAEQVGRTMIAFEKTIQATRPDWVVLVGDVNATCACSITAKKEQLPVAHIEAGLRSFDPSMPEEINRLVTDRLSDLLFTTDHIADANLRQEGVAAERIRRVGNIMIDTLEQNRARAAALRLSDILSANKLPESRARIPDHVGTVVTLHRPANVDSPAVLLPLVRFLADEVAADSTLVWPVHPRTQKQLDGLGLWTELLRHPRLLFCHPLGYHEMLKLNMTTQLLLTDSGGLQEEACVLGTPCLTLRANTERPVTLHEHGGSNLLVGNQVEQIRRGRTLCLGLGRRQCRPPLWDGHTAERIVATFAELGRAS